jgi:hypothetical protein
MSFIKRRGEPATVEEEREALREQRLALEDLKLQLAERVAAVRERELELQDALREAGGKAPARKPSPLPPQPAPDVAEADTGENAPAAQRRERELAERERAVAAREARLLEGEQALELRSAEAQAGLDERERELAARASLDGVMAPAANSAEPDAERLARIEARLTELREAEKLFLRTRDELAARSEAVAARERLVAQKERELDEREDAGVSPWDGAELSEMEARLRRLEQRELPGERTQGFSGGLRKLQEGTKKPQQPL